MKKEYLDRITFLNNNQIMIDEQYSVSIKKVGANRNFIYEGEIFEDEEELFQHIDEITSTGSVGGGYEGPGLAEPDQLMRKPKFPYTQIVENVEKLVKRALIEEYVKEHPNYKLIEIYRDQNAKNSEEHLKNVEIGIKIVYDNILPAQAPNYYRDNNDYNGDGIPNINKENEGLLDVKYDAASQTFKERNAQELSKDPSGKKMMDAAVKKAEVRDANYTNKPILQYGNDIEFAPQNNTEKDNKTRTGVSTLGFAPLKESKNMSHLKFKFKNKEFKDISTLIESVPDKVKVENTLFEMQDATGNNFLIEWKDGQGVILEHTNILSEEKKLNRVENLFEKLNDNSKVKKTKNIKFEMFTKNLNEETEEVDTSDLWDYRVPEWAMPTLINGDNSALTEEDDKKIKEFIAQVIEDCGNAHIVHHKKRGFCHNNDIDNLGSDCYTIYIKPSKEI